MSERLVSIYRYFKRVFSLIDTVALLLKSINMNQHTNQEYNTMASLFRIIGHPVRIQIIYLLNEGPRCVCEVAGELNLNKSVTSKHLAQLKEVGVVSMIKNGTQVTCSIKMPCIITLMECVIHPEKHRPQLQNLSLCRKGCE